MDQMGLSVCCLMCDAPDTPGTSRCKSCISRHSAARNALFSDRAETGLEQLARKLGAMLADPSSHTADPAHGNWMSTYHQALLRHQGNNQPDTIEEIQKIFEIERNKQADKGPISLSDQNQWSTRPPNDSEISDALEKLSLLQNTENGWWSELEQDIESMEKGES